MNVYSDIQFIEKKSANDKGRSELVSRFLCKVRSYASKSGVMGKDAMGIGALLKIAPEIKIYCRDNLWSGGSLILDPSKMTRKHKHHLRKYLEQWRY